MRKRYGVLVYVHPSRNRGELVDYLRKEGSLARVVCEGSPEAKRAVLQYQIRQSVSGETDKMQGCTCLDIYIDTGRFHQIRCQLSHAGMPVLGDRKYGTEESLEMSRKMGIRHTALCACGLWFRHPVSGREVSHEICPDWAKQG